MDGLDGSAWLRLLAQGTRFITLDTPATDGLLVERFNGREGVNEGFRFTLDGVSASAFMDVSTWPGKPVHLAIATDAGARRHWHGYITRASTQGADGGLARYQLVMESALAFLRLRRNTLIFQDKTALDVIGAVFADYPELSWRNDATAPLRTRPICTQYRESDAAFVTRLLGEEGLSYRFEHTQGDAGSSPGHTLVIFDPAASQSLPAGTPASIRFHRINATEATDAISVFAERRQIVPDQVSTASWRADQVQALAGSAQANATEGAPELPTLDVFAADRASRFDTTAQADAWAAHRLDARRLLAHTFSGQGSVRTLEAGKIYVLTEHPELAGQAPSTSSGRAPSPSSGQAPPAGSGQALSTSSGQAFIPLWVEHTATHNLGSDLPHEAGHADADAEALGKGNYRNTFLAVPAGTRIASMHTDRPLAPGCSSALVVGVPGSVLTGTRDHQVRIAFFWQRGVAPLPGGLTDTASAANPQGHAPGDDHSGTWVRVAEPSAGAHHGASFVPRLGDEVLVEYAHGDIDQPVVVGQLYNGPAHPPFAAGEGSGANHPGTLSGVQTQTLDGQAGSRWVLDDASGQLRHSLMNTLAGSALNLGYLIDQQGAVRGGYHGEGFALMTEGWAVARAGEGLLLSATARSQGQSTQMNSAEAIAQLKAAEATAKRLDTAASQATATPLAANPAHAALRSAIDPQKAGKYTGAVGGQPTTKPTGSQRHGGAPVERYAQPAMLLESPARIALTTPRSAAIFAGEHLHATSQRDTHLASGTAIALAAGANAGLYAADGGIKLIANHGPVSLEAHTDALQILADQNVTVTSTTDRIDVLAKDTLTLQAGQSRITLDGQNLTITCPGTFTVKTSQHQWLGGEGQKAELPVLPDGVTPLTTLKLDHRYHDNQALPGAEYEARLADGSVRKGKLDAGGKASIDDAPIGMAEVRFGPSNQRYQPDGPTNNPAYKPNAGKADFDAAIAKYWKPAPAQDG